MNSLKVSWDPPAKKNGDIIGYIVTYETTEQNERKYIRINYYILFLLA